MICDCLQLVTLDIAGPCACSRTVVAGDTCISIANAKGIANSTLLSLNPAINDGCTNLEIGQVKWGKNEVFGEIHFVSLQHLLIDCSYFFANGLYSHDRRIARQIKNT